MKIVHLISSLNRGGRERQLATIVKYDSDNNNLIICINKTHDTYVAEYGLHNKVKYITSKRFLGRIFEIRKKIMKENPDIVWTWGGFETTFVFLIRTICYKNFKIINGSIRHGIVKLNRKQLWRLFLLHLSKYRVANSFAGLKANRLNKGFVLYNGIDKNLIIKKKLTLQERQQQKDLLKIEDKCLILLSVANLVPYKDYITVFKALKMLKDKKQKFKYFVIGEGPMRGVLEKKIQEYKLIDEIVLLGRQTNVKQWLSFSDIFLHSSKGEGFSNAILEAMANGLPVVATNTGGTSEIISSDVGVLFEYKDSNRLFEIILELAVNKDLKRKLGERALRVVKKKYTTEVMIYNYNNILKKVIND